MSGTRIPLDYRYNEDFIWDIEDNNQIEIVTADREYDIQEAIKADADILIPLHEPGFASVNTIGKQS